MYCKVCGNECVIEDYCSPKCDSLALLGIRAIDSVVLIDGVPCGAIHSLFDKANKKVLYYGTLDWFTGFKTQVQETKSDVLAALIVVSDTVVVEIPPEPANGS